MNSQLSLFDIPQKPILSPNKGISKVIGGIYLDKGVKPSEATEWMLGIGRDCFVIYDGIQHIEEIVDIATPLDRLDYIKGYALKIKKDTWHIVSSAKTKNDPEYEIASGKHSGDVFRESLKPILKIFHK